jgi:Cu-Zn family superoxide dismutase
MIQRLIPVAAAILVSACSSYTPDPSATARLAPTTGNSTNGTITFTQMGSFVQIHGEVRGLAPNKYHGFHIHENGDCSSGDGMSAGGHFNPTKKQHGAHDGREKHAGDLVSLKADDKGIAHVKYIADSISILDGESNVVGKGLIVHRDPDDYRTQPTGNSGPRIACAVITKN